jgi:general nucleoside transport system ATP-binding protein
MGRERDAENMMKLVEMRRIVKRFPRVLANDSVDFDVAVGEIHAVLGENGAGKSTLMQILYGFYQRDSGDIFLDGAAVEFARARDAISRGIGMIHQDFMLVRPFTVVENVVLGLYEEKGGRLNLESASEAIRDLSLRHGLAVDAAARIEHLPIGVQQRVEILKLLYRRARLLILDEPTAVLTPQEKDSLFAVLRGLAAEGKSIVIVTHKLREVMEVSDRVTVMRGGRVVASLKTKATSERELARLMVGRDVALRANKAAVEPGEIVLRIEDLRSRDDAGYEKLRGVSLELRAGEIVGIAGVDGNGQSQLAEATMNLRKVEGGRVVLRGVDLTHSSPAQHRAAGLAYIPADRRGVGSVAELSIADNAMLGSHRERTRCRGAFRDETAIRAHAARLVARFGVRTPNLDFAAGKLSGGNLQKLTLGRELMRDPLALVVEQPTRGLDVGAIETVWTELLAQRAAGKAILLISAELDEIFNLADRIAVMFEGRIIGMLAAAATAEAVGLLMAGREAHTAEMERTVSV